jgi:hypothetical protein
MHKWPIAAGALAPFSSTVVADRASASSVTVFFSVPFSVRFSLAAAGTARGEGVSTVASWPGTETR